jgi:hypothetical protein
MKDIVRMESAIEALWSGDSPSTSSLIDGINDSFDAIRAEFWDYLIVHRETLRELSQIMKIPKDDVSDIVRGRLRFVHAILNDYNEDDIAKFGGVESEMDLVWHYASIYLVESSVQSIMVISAMCRSPNRTISSLAKNLLVQHLDDVVPSNHRKVIDFFDRV